MPEVTISPAAREDLLDIGRYTQGEWGAAQRNTYLRALADSFDSLVGNVRAGRKRDDLRTNLLAHPAGGHMIFFRRDPDGNVEIIRVLHQRQDFERHL